MNKGGKPNLGIINCILIIGALLSIVALYQIGTVSILSTQMKDIENSWVPAIDENSIGHYDSYYANDSVNIVGRITYSETVENVISNPYELFYENVSNIYQNLKTKGYHYLYSFDDSNEILLSKTFYSYEEDHIYEIKLHDWYLGDTNYWIWTLESKGESVYSTVTDSIPLLIVGLIILISGAVARKIRLNHTKDLISQRIYNNSNELPKNNRYHNISQEESNNGVYICNKCGLKVDQTYRFCPNCGNRKKEINDTCPNCGKISPISVNYCPYCGGKKYE